MSGPDRQPPSLILTPTPAGRAVFCLWAALPGVLIAPFVFWQGAGWGFVFCAVWAAGVAMLWRRTASLKAELNAHALVIEAGRFFPTRRIFPRCTIASVLELGSPLMRMAGARVLVLLAPGAGAVLPGVDRAQAEALCEALGRLAPIREPPEAPS